MLHRLVGQHSLLFWKNAKGGSDNVGRISAPSEHGVRVVDLSRHSGVVEHSVLLETG